MRSFLIKFLCVLLLLVGIERLSHSLTDGFSYASISSDLPDNPNWNVVCTEEDLKEAEMALNQPYRYLESGSQSYVFVSRDENYVLKFFKHKRWRLHPILDHLPLPPSLHKKRERWKEKKKETVNATFDSCIASYSEFKNETGVLFVRLNKHLPFDHILTVKDRIGFKHRIQLTDVEFVIQKKAIPTDKYLLSLKEKGMLKKAEKSLDDLIAFTIKRAEKGYSDKDPHLIRNFGFIDDQAIEIDIGGFHRDPKKDLTYFYSHEMVKIKGKLIPWLEKNYPELLPYAEKKF